MKKGEKINKINIFPGSDSLFKGMIASTSTLLECSRRDNIYYFFASETSSLGEPFCFGENRDRFLSTVAIVGAHKFQHTTEMNNKRALAMLENKH